MAEDTRGFIEREISYGESVLGRKPTPDEFGRQFAKYDLHERALKLEELKADLSGRTFANASEAAEYSTYERAFSTMHNVLCKVNR